MPRGLEVVAGGLDPGAVERRTPPRLLHAHVRGHALGSVRNHGHDDLQRPCLLCQHRRSRPFAVVARAIKRRESADDGARRRSRTAPRPDASFPNRQAEGKRAVDGGDQGRESRGGGSEPGAGREVVAGVHGDGRQVPCTTHLSDQPRDSRVRCRLAVDAQLIPLGGGHDRSRGERRQGDGQRRRGRIVLSGRVGVALPLFAPVLDERDVRMRDSSCSHGSVPSPGAGSVRRSKSYSS